LSAVDDRRFLDWLNRAIGVLAGFVAGFSLLASYVAGGDRAEQRRDDPDYQRQVAERIAPIASVAIVSNRSPLAEQVASTAVMTTVAPPAVADAVLSGEQVYNMACVACHGVGLAGAPKFGDKAAWVPRLAQGTSVLHEHALRGFQGKAGVMPAKGGRVDLADQSIVNAADYIVNAAK